MNDQSSSLTQLIRKFSSFRKSFIICNLAIDTWPVIYANDEFIQLLDRKRNEIIGQSIKNCEIWLGSQNERSKKTENQLKLNDKWNQLKFNIKAKKDFNFDIPLRKSNGKLINCKILMTSIKYTDLIVLIFEKILNDQENFDKQMTRKKKGFDLFSSKSFNQSLDNKKTMLIKKTKSIYLNNENQKDQKLSIISQLFLHKKKNKDGVSIGKSKSLENTTFLENKQVVPINKSKVFSCGNINKLKRINSILQNEHLNEQNNINEFSKKIFNMEKNSKSLISISNNKIIDNNIKISKPVTKEFSQSPLHLHLIKNQIDVRRQSAGDTTKKNFSSDLEDLFLNQRNLTDQNNIENKIFKPNYFSEYISSNHKFSKTNSSSSIEINLNNDDDIQSIQSKISKSTLNSTKTNSPSSNSLFKLPFSLFNTKSENSEKKNSLCSVDINSRNILKGVPNKLTTNISSKVAQVSKFLN